MTLPYDTQRELLALMQQEIRFSRFHNWLTAEGVSASLVVMVFLAPTITLMIMVAAAVLFTPYLLWQLYQSRWYGWMVGFGIFVGVPTLVTLLLQTEGYMAMLLSLWPLFMFYTYTWALRHAVGDWLSHAYWKRRNIRGDEYKTALTDM